MSLHRILVFCLAYYTAVVRSSSTCDVTLDGPFTGEITHYDHAHIAAEGTGECMIDTGGDLMVAAMNLIDLNDRLLCGQCVEITNENNVKITVKVIDSCPECPEHNIDLSLDAFALLYPVEVGRRTITWRLVECEKTENIKYNFKFPDTGGNWWAIKPIGHVHGVQSMSLKPAEEGDTRDWTEYVRTKNHNFKKDPDMRRINVPFHLRITSTLGEVIEDFIDTDPTTNIDTLPGNVQFQSICDRNLENSTFSIDPFENDQPTQDPNKAAYTRCHSLYLVAFASFSLYHVSFPY